MNTDDKLIPLKEAAQRLGMSQTALIRRVQRGSVSAQKVGWVWMIRENTLHSISHRSRPRKGDHPLFITWRGMMNRCYQPSDSGYINYGGRGIFVDKRWHDFDTFVKDVGDRPPNTTLDRVNNEGPYSPDNFRWATHHQQQSNKRRRK